MTVTARKYNPGFLSDDELVASFCVRTHEFASILEMLRECTGASNTHQLAIGPRGSGKTSLLLRVAAEVRRAPELQSRFFPIVFAEESYEVATAGEFWLECLAHLAAQATRGDDGPDLHRTFGELRAIRDDRTLGDRCLGALQDFSDREGKRLVLLVENLNMMFRDMSDPDAGWRLRKVLQTEPRIVLLASATSRFDEIDDPEHALYEQFRVLSLRPLDTDECAALWEAVAGRGPRPGTIRSLEILTGGSPRLLTIVARFGAELSFRKLMASLLDLIDDHTEYFKSHLESLPAQERRVYLALATLWKPATTREISDQARIDTSKCSAQLTRLVDRGAVQTAGGSARRKQYYLTERLYNIYYLLRRSRSLDRLVEALIRFMESYYSPSELMDIGARIIREAESFTNEMQSLSQAALSQLVELPALARYRDRLLVMKFQYFKELQNIVEPNPAVSTSAGIAAPDHDLAPRDVVELVSSDLELDRGRADRLRETADESAEQIGKTLHETAVGLIDQSRWEEALDACDEMMRRFGEGEVTTSLKWAARSLVTKGAILARMNRPLEALAAWDEVVSRFGQSGTPILSESVAKAIFNKGVTLDEMNRPKDALDAWEAVIGQFGQTESPELLEVVAMALASKASTLVAMDRPQDALETCDEAVEHFEQSDSPIILQSVAASLSLKGSVLLGLNRLQEAIDAWEEVTVRFRQNEDPDLRHMIATTLADKGFGLFAMNRLQDSLDACDQALRYCEESDDPTLLQSLVMALSIKAMALAGMNRWQDALDACDQTLRYCEENKDPALLQPLVVALSIKASAFAGMNRWQDALGASDQALRHCEESEAPALLQPLVMALYIKAMALAGMNRWQDALDACDQAVRHYEENEDPTLLQPLVIVLSIKASALAEMNRWQDALDACDRAVCLLDNGIPIFLQPVAMVFMTKGSLLGKLNQLEDALAAYDEVIRRFGENEFPIFGTLIGEAYLGRAEIEIKCRRFEAAAETVGQAFERCHLELPEDRLRGHLVRGKATLAVGERAACEHDMAETLELLPRIGFPQKESFAALISLSLALGAERMCELIKGSPSADILLPLTTALELELGLEPRVALEVKEVAEDIRRDLAKLREEGADGLGGTKAVSPEAVAAERKDV